MDGRIVLLNTAIVAAPQEFAVTRKQRRANGDAAFGEAKTRFVESDLQH